MSDSLGESPRIALDATYSVGDELSGVGLYSREMLLGLAAAHPEARFDFCYRPHRYWRSWANPLPANARRRLLAEPLGPRAADLFHGLNQRLPRIPLRRAVTTFHDLFVLTGEYSTEEFRARFAAQARDAAARSAAIIAVSAFTKNAVVSLLGVEASKVRVVHHGVRGLPYSPAPREKVVLNVGAIQKRKNIARLVEAFETLEPGWRLVLAGSFGYGSADILARIEHSPARDRISVLGYVSPTSSPGGMPGHDFRFPIARRRLRNARAGSHGGGNSGGHIQPLGAPRSGGRRCPPGGSRRHRGPWRGTARVSWERGFETGSGAARHGTGAPLHLGEGGPRNLGRLSGSAWLMDREMPG